MLESLNEQLKIDNWNIIIPLDLIEGVLDRVQHRNILLKELHELTGKIESQEGRAKFRLNKTCEYFYQLGTNYHLMGIIENQQETNVVYYLQLSDKQMSCHIIDSASLELDLEFALNQLPYENDELLGLQNNLKLSEYIRAANRYVIENFDQYIQK